jgi:hypothetical protein
MGLFSSIGFGRVNAGRWTQIYSGPAVHPLPFMSFNFRAVPSTATLTFLRTIDIYNAVFGYHRFAGTSVANPTSVISIWTPELVVADPASPWTNVWILTDTTIDAKCW